MKKTILFSSLILVLVYVRPASAQQAVTAAEIIQSVIRQVGVEPISHTVDVIKEGDPQTRVTGVVTCMFATLDVLREAVSKKCNLIIAHEPTFYNHLDDKKDFEHDAVFLEKQKYILDHHLVVWRFHDYIHSLEPDPMLLGLIEKLGWQKWVANAGQGYLIFPKTPLTELLKDMKAAFPKSTFNVVGKREMKVTHVRLIPGAAGSQRQIHLLESDSVDLVIAGEVPQWETYEYTRDAASEGRNKALVLLGHIPSEEPGMSYVVPWLKKFITQVPVIFIPCEPSYWPY